MRFKRNRFEETKGSFLTRHQDNVFLPLFFTLALKRMKTFINDGHIGQTRVLHFQTEQLYSPCYLLTTPNQQFATT